MEAGRRGRGRVTRRWSRRRLGCVSFDSEPERIERDACTRLEAGWIDGQRSICA